MILMSKTVNSNNYVEINPLDIDLKLMTKVIHNLFTPRDRVRETPEIEKRCVHYKTDHREFIQI